MFQCTGSYSSTVSNVPSGYAIGNCLNGVHLDRTVKSDQVSSPPGYLDGGFIHGNYNGCGWVGTNWDALLYDQTNNPCSDSASHGQAEFMYYENGHYIINDESSQDGTPLQTIRDCTEYANFRPWSATPAESDAIRTVPAGDTINGQWRLRWRWLTARRSTLTNAYFYMVRDTAAPPATATGCSCRRVASSEPRQVLRGATSGAPRRLGQMIRSTFALIVTAAACIAAAVPAQIAQARSATVTRVSMDHEHVDGAAQSLHGTIMIRTSAAHLRRVSHDGAPTARFTATVSTTCTARIAVSGRAVATTATPAEQAKRTTRIRRVPLGHDTRADGAWELVEQNVVDPNTQKATGGKQLYGVAVVHIAPHRFVHVRAIGRYEGTCAVDDRLDGRAVDAIKHLLISASVRARVLPN